METHLSLIIPELYQLLLTGLLFIQSIAGKRRLPDVEKWLPWGAGLGIVIGVLCLDLEGLLFAQCYRVDTLSQFFKWLLALGFTLTVLNASRPPELDREKRCEYFLFLALSVWGFMLLSSCVELMCIFLALELASFSLFPLVPLRGGNSEAAEAAVKYIFFGAAASVISLFGFSYILASQHTTFLTLLVSLPWDWSLNPLAVAGISLFLCGLLFKLAVFPFHSWAPDVYQGAGNETSAYISTMPKVGAIVVLIRFVPVLKPGLDVTVILAVLAAVSMTYGNLAALVQKDVKRLLGYSAIAHAGYILVGMVAGTAMGVSAAAFYAFIYVLMNFTCFWVICRVSEDGRNLQLSDLDGLHERAPVLALVLTVGAVSLVGLPPTAGFMGKLFLLTAAWDREVNWLVIVGAVNVAVSLYYYLNIVRHAYTGGDRNDRTMPISRPLFSNAWGGILAALLVLLGIFPGPLFAIALKVGYGILGK